VERNPAMAGARTSVAAPKRGDKRLLSTDRPDRPKGSEDVVQPSQEQVLADDTDNYRLALELAGMDDTRIALPADRVLRLGPMQFHAAEWPHAAPANALFLHGAGLTCHTWDLVCMGLPQLHSVALDLRGHGDSDWSEALDYRIADHVADVVGLADELAGARHLVVGMSLGAMVALGYTLSRPDRVSGLVLIDVAPPGSDQPAGGLRIRQFMDDTAEFDSIEDCVEHALRFNPRRDARLLRWTLLRNLRTLPNGKLTWKYDRRHRVGPVAERLLQDNARERDRMWRAAEKLDVPVMLIRGADSDVTTGAGMRSFAQRLPGWRYAEAPNAGHSVQGDNPSFVIHAIEQLISDRQVERS
jgi:pimeloyl-ACP methyl ester carboxylesterase